MPRPKIDLHKKVRELLGHTTPLPSLTNLPSVTSSPIRLFEIRVNACNNLSAYIEDHISPESVYAAVYERHMSLLRRMILVGMIEAFERFLKELATICVDHIAPIVIDDRFEKFQVSSGGIALHFNAKSVGKALCESGTWLSNKEISDRFQQILKPHFGDKWERLFPSENQPPRGEHDRSSTLAILWQVRHNITHNTGLLTGADAKRLTILAKSSVHHGEVLTPETVDLRYVKRFLVETAQHTNQRVGKRLAEFLTERNSDDATLLSDPQGTANNISDSFQLSLRVAGKTGFI